ncbi:MAG: YceI family protein [Mycobacteriaceae bacterium]|nr:YceI family protein [Mycobacteriaceae bacterium]
MLTGVAGRAAALGHRLTLVMRQWQATVQWSGGQPVGAQLVVAVDSLEVLRGDGGVKGLSGPEKTLVRSNALKTLNAERFPQICFTADTIDQTQDGYLLGGVLQIHGVSRDQVINLRTKDCGDSWQMLSQCVVRQSNFGIKPYSLLMGSLRVADQVLVSWTASHIKDDVQ